VLRGLRGRAQCSHPMQAYALISDAAAHVLYSLRRICGPGCSLDQILLLSMRVQMHVRHAILARLDLVARLRATDCVADTAIVSQLLAPQVHFTMLSASPETRPVDCWRTSLRAGRSVVICYTHVASMHASALQGIS
jgi:hypothetical protein